VQPSRLHGAGETPAPQEIVLHHMSEGVSMRFESRAFRLAKDAEHPEENQDACRTDAVRGVAAIADGVSSGIFSRDWARILTDAIVDEAPNPDDKEAFAGWLAARRETWSGGIDVSQLAWHQKPKLRDGAFSTLLWVEIRALDDEDRRPEDPWRLRAFAVGDSCLFHVRDGKLLRTFPIEQADQFEENPVVIGSVDLNRDELVEFKLLDEYCRPGDLLVLCTDAVAAWAFRLREAGSPPDWQSYWTMTEEAWRDEIAALRDRREMRYDDATLLLVRVTDGVTLPEPDDEATISGETATVVDRPALPPPAEALPESDWAEKLKSFSEQLAGQVSGRFAKGMKKLKEVKESAESALRKYQEKLRSKDDEPPSEE
jgi:hypothetical protein